MTSQKKIVIGILLFLARYINDDKEFATELRNLANHISVEKWKNDTL